MYRYDDAITILVNHFSEMKDIYELNMDDYEDLPYVFYESEFVKFIVNSANADNKKMLREVFDFVEDMLKNGDEKVVNLLEVAVVESIYFDNNILDKKAIESYFGALTLKSYKDCFQQHA
ncbi:MAG: hypothetical protein AAGU76_11810 [Sedimentibacter sp.]|uniref:DUF7674 family protein n=1 Tax=Sedimentibacter sp. TaxID=1960295 RepID=UPI00315913E9